MEENGGCPLCQSNPLEQTTKLTNISWIQCDICEEWFHSNCLGLRINDVNNLHSYHCEKCSKKHGPSVEKRRLKRKKLHIDYVALNDGETYAVDKTAHPHVDNFLNFEVNANEAGDKGNPYFDILDHIDQEYIYNSRLKKPVLVPNADYKKVGMHLPYPSSEITIDRITTSVGEDLPVEVMDVLTQQSVVPGWKMWQWRDYFHTDTESRDRIRNVISLEISDVDALGKDFIRPSVVRNLDLVDKVWQSRDERPKVTKYCLMSVGGSFTDFHVDFSGTAVYYNVCIGSKTFLMYPPSPENLGLYESWCLEPDQNYTWFGDYHITKGNKKVAPSGGFKITLQEGDLFFIPSGWIHSVYTSQDSVVLGGNFLTLMSLPTHLDIYEIEKRTKVPSKYQFPKFNKVLWLTSFYYLSHQQEFVEDIEGHSRIKKEDFPPDEESGALSISGEVLERLIEHLKKHYEKSKTSQVARNGIPTEIIGKDVEKFLKTLESWLDNIRA